MKKFFALCVLLFFVGVTIFVIKEYEKKDMPVISDIIPVSSIDERNEETENGKIYAVWLTYSEIGSIVKDKSESEYRKSLQALFDNLLQNKINTVFYQCRAFCDSFYYSDIFPVSKYVYTDTNQLTFDPLEIFLSMGKSYGVSIHCWLNPYRVSYDGEFENLPQNSPVRNLYKNDKSTLIICDKGIYLNPAHNESVKLVLDGIREILKKYDVDGIHFDDYFYPESKNIKDDVLYKKYKKEGGNLALNQWRRENVNALVGSVYSLVKSFDESLIFSISPSADIEKCKNVFYADVEKWCNEEGFADYIIPQIYYGYDNEKMPFDKVLEEWEKLSVKGNVNLLCGLAVYKCGRVDEFAGDGKKEWIENVNILSQQYEQTLKSPVWQGFSLFSYSYAFGENTNQISKKEIKNLLCMVE